MIKNKCLEERRNLKQPYRHKQVKRPALLRIVTADNHCSRLSCTGCHTFLYDPQYDTAIIWHAAINYCDKNIEITRQQLNLAGTMNVT